MDKKISVIIPIFNTEEFLHESIGSVINQTYKNIEIVIIDDASTQSCKQVITEMTNNDNRIITYELSDRRGVGAARNLGINKATGDYIYFLDSDDYIPETTLELLISNIKESSIITGLTKSINKMTADDLNLNEKETVIEENCFDLFKKMSALHLLIKRDFIKENNILFSEEVQFFSDLGFILPILAEKKSIPYVPDSIYYKRTRNDPITNPSLMQLDNEKQMVDFLNIYTHLKNTYKEKSYADRFLDHLFLNYYRRSIIVIMNSQEKIERYFNQLFISTKKLDFKNIPKQNPIINKELKAIKKNNKGRFSFLLKSHNWLSSLKTALSGRTKLLIYVYQNFLIKLPLKEKTIVFESFLGKNYSDSPKNIYEYMYKQNTDYKYIWIFNEKRNIPGPAKQIKRFSFSYYYYLATAKYWVSNSRLPLHLTKREGNVYLQTWHGTPLKKLVFDMNDIHSANPNYKLHFYKQSRRWDYLISANQYSSDIFRSAFKFEKEMLEYGYPRNDALHSKNKDEISKEIKQNLGIPLTKKVVLYAPTWRDDEFYSAGKYKFKLRLNLKKMKEELGDEYIILLRMHYFIANNIETDGVEDFAYNLSKYNDIADLYLISDILITDYSSVFFDYANLKRPILFYTYDLEKYRDTLRGFYINMENEVPGPLLMTSDEVIDSIKNINEVTEKYKYTYDQFYEKICGWEKGNATEQVVKRVFNV
ncbi:bifunctional glycosyltransferase/CDP-glycerol:glycerophosphate glycerophosphotransferase [Bacillus suaedaesalsae]|nr:CDP-glycerol:glycerophosphate glycerophosphotransferase [Bacillus suaedaesalsae]